MKFEIDSNIEQWFEGIIVSYNSVNQKYKIHFPCDNDTVEASIDDEDLEFM